MRTDGDPVELSILAPALNEEANVGPLVAQVKAAVIDCGIAAELIIVDDGSTDGTLAHLRALAAGHPWLRVLYRQRAMGQSAAMWAGIAAARGRYVGMLDADLQNDPADLPRLLELLKHHDVDLVQGDRSGNRRDTVIRRCSSWVGRTTRRLLLADPIRDTGCTARVMKAEFARQLPLQFQGMHRYIPVYCRMVGARVLEAPVNHRPRVAGVAKYGMCNRGLVGLFDCLTVRWMLKRYRDPAAEQHRHQETQS